MGVRCDDFGFKEMFDYILDMIFAFLSTDTKSRVANPGENTTNKSVDDMEDVIKSNGLNSGQSNFSTFFFMF